MKILVHEDNSQKKVAINNDGNVINIDKLINHFQINDINQHSSEKKVEEIIEKGGNAQFIKADITNENSTEEMVKQIIERGKCYEIMYFRKKR